MSQIDRVKYINPYSKINTIEQDNGYIIWRRATGDNVEILHLRVSSPGKGIGRELVNRMLKELLENPPYATLFGFTRISNEISQKFFTALGFELSEVKGVYADGSAILFSQTYKTLLEIHNVQSPAY